jgi:hypothetical protein
LELNPGSAPVPTMGWKEPKFSVFLDRSGKFRVAVYMLWKENESKNQQAHNTVFSMLLEDMQHKKTNVWIILVELVQENEGIVNFKASRHHMWIWAKRLDPKKK